MAKALTPRRRKRRGASPLSQHWERGLWPRPLHVTNALRPYTSDPPDPPFVIPIEAPPREESFSAFCIAFALLGATHDKVTQGLASLSDKGVAMPCHGEISR